MRILIVDDEPLADTHETIAFVANLFGKGFLHLAEVHTDGGFQLVHHDDICIVAAGLEIDNLRDIYPLQLIAGIEKYVVFYYCHS